MYGDLGWQETIYRIKFSDYLSDHDYPVSSFIPSGLYNTLCIIEHRNKLLNGLFDSDGENYEIPAANENSTEVQKLNNIFTRLGTGNNSTREYLFYYPAASYAYAYSPITDESKLLDKFKPHNWFLPASGDALRIMYHLSKTEGADAIFKKAIEDGVFLNHRNTLWSSSENTINYAISCPTNGYVNTEEKDTTYNVRPICMF
jgi:hypothetical protein